MIIASCLIAIIGCATSQPQLGIEQFEDISKQAGALLKDRGSGTIDAKFEIAFSDGHAIIERADSATAKFSFSDSSWHTKYKIVGVAKTETGNEREIIKVGTTERKNKYSTNIANKPPIIQANFTSLMALLIKVD